MSGTVSLLRYPQGGWELKGVVRSPFVLSSGRFIFQSGSVVRLGADHVIRGVPENEAEIALRCVHPVRELAARCDPGKMGTADLARAGDTSSSEYMLRLVPSDEITVGRHQFAVRVKGITPDDHEVAVRIPAVVHVVDDLVFSPAVLLFGYVTLGSETVSKTVALRSRLNEAFAVESIECDTSLVKVSLLSSDYSGQETRLRVSLRADQKGPQGTTVRVGVRYPERQITAYRNIRVLYTGMQNPREAGDEH